MFYALSHIEESFLAENLFTFAALSPCTIELTEGDRMYTDGLFQFEDFGIYAINGPNWDQDLQTICEYFDQEICDFYTSYTGDIATSVQNYVHWAQNVIEGRY